MTLVLRSVFQSSTGTFKRCRVSVSSKPSSRLRPALGHFAEEERPGWDRRLANAYDLRAHRRLLDREGRLLLVSMAFAGLNFAQAFDSEWKIRRLLPMSERHFLAYLAAERRGASPGCEIESVAPCRLWQPFGFSNFAYLFTRMTVTWCCGFRDREPYEYL